MPYKSVDEAVKKHPNLNKYSAKAQRAWFSAFNSAFDSGKSDEASFSVAYSVANKVDGKATINGNSNFNQRRSKTDEVKIAKELVRLSRMLASAEVTSAELGDLDKTSREFVTEFLAKRKEVLKIKEEIKSLTKTLSEKLKAIEKRMTSLEEELVPALEKADGQFVRVETLILAYDTKKSQTPKYKSVLEMAFTKIDAALRKLLEEALEASRETKRWVDVREASMSRHAGIFSTLSDAIKGIWSKIMGVKKSADKFEDAVDDLEKAVKS